MKNFSIIFCFAFLLLYSCTKDSANSTEKTEKEVVIQNFDDIEISSSIQVEMVKSDVEKVEVVATRKVLDQMEINISNNKLKVKMKPGAYFTFNNSSPRVKIYATDFNRISAGFSSTVSIQDKFLSESMDVEIKSSSVIKGDLEANDFNLDISSSSRFEGNIWALNLTAEVSSSSAAAVSGKAANCFVETGSSSSFDGIKFIADAAEVDASSSSSIEISVKKSLKASASSSSTIQYRVEGNQFTRANVETSSSGSVSKID